MGGATLTRRETPPPPPASERGRGQRGFAAKNEMRALLVPVLAVLLLSALYLAMRDRLTPDRDASFHHPFRVSGQLVRAADGDSFVLASDDRGEIRVRLHAIDAPEAAQSHGAASTQRLLEATQERALEVACYKTDARGREVCRVFVDRFDLQVALVRAGSAWHFRQFDDEQTREERRELAAAEADARRAKRGLWAEPDPMPPWECRALLREMKSCP